jgi:hypothetical protein
MPVLRGLAWVQNHRNAILMTRGYIPRMETYPGMEVPLPLEVEICRGEVLISGPAISNAPLAFKHYI